MGIERKAHATTTDSFRTRIRAGRFEFLADEPIEVGGGDTGPTPYELLLASLAACTNITLRSYADRKGWALRKIDVELTFRKADAHEGRPRDVIVRELRFDGELDAEQRARLVEIAQKCPVSRTLVAGADVHTSEVKS